jgi:hypothetical protein
LRMAFYVDDAHILWRGRRWSHMVADHANDPHRAAEALGLRREWAHDGGRTLHYDLPDSVRGRAIRLGIAAPISWRELARKRAAREPELPEPDARSVAGLRASAPIRPVARE